MPPMAFSLYSFIYCSESPVCVCFQHKKVNYCYFFHPHFSPLSCGTVSSQIGYLFVRSPQLDCTAGRKKTKNKNTSAAVPDCVNMQHAHPACQAPPLPKHATDWQSQPDGLGKHFTHGKLEHLQLLGYPDPRPAKSTADKGENDI